MTSETTNIPVPYSYLTEQRKETFQADGVPVLSLNLKYPVFSSVSDGKGERDDPFVRRVNRFYGETADRYLASAKRFVGKAAALYRTNGGVRTALTLDGKIAYADADYVSIFTDISVFNGKTVRIRRFSQLWSTKKKAILPASYVFNGGGRTKRYLKELLLALADKNARRKDFAYFDNYPSIIKSKFDLSSFYFVPNGVAFFYDNGVLSASMPDVCVFVLPFEKIDGVLKIVPGVR